MTEEKKADEKEFYPTFYGFTGGIREDESMAEFVKRVNKEGGK